jgi:hypothetical protein
MQHLGQRFQREAVAPNLAGLVVHGDFILGLPGETNESIRNTIEFAKRLDCETIQVSMAQAFPGRLPIWLIGYSWRRASTMDNPRSGSVSNQKTFA